MNNYEYWLTFDEETKKELESITDKAELPFLHPVARLEGRFLLQCIEQ